MVADAFFDRVAEIVVVDGDAGERLVAGVAAYTFLLIVVKASQKFDDSTVPQRYRWNPVRPLASLQNI